LRQKSRAAKDLKNDNNQEDAPIKSFQSIAAQAPCPVQEMEELLRQIEVTHHAMAPSIKRNVNGAANMRRNLECRDKEADRLKSCFVEFQHSLDLMEGLKADDLDDIIAQIKESGADDGAIDFSVTESTCMDLDDQNVILRIKRSSGCSKARHKHHESETVVGKYARNDGPGKTRKFKPKTLVTAQSKHSKKAPLINHVPKPPTASKAGSKKKRSVSRGQNRPKSNHSELKSTELEMEVKLRPIHTISKAGQSGIRI